MSYESAVKTVGQSSINTKELGRARTLQSRRLLREMMQAKGKLDQAKRSLVMSRIERKDERTSKEFLRVFAKFGLPVMALAMAKLKQFHRAHNESLVDRLVRASKLKQAQASSSLTSGENSRSFSTTGGRSTSGNGDKLFQLHGEDPSPSTANYSDIFDLEASEADRAIAFEHLNSIKRRLDFTDKTGLSPIDKLSLIAQRHKQVRTRQRESQLQAWITSWLTLRNQLATFEAKLASITTNHAFKHWKSGNRAAKHRQARSSSQMSTVFSKWLEYVQLSKSQRENEARRESKLVSVSAWLQAKKC